jgi:hypothetical protein
MVANDGPWPLGVCRAAMPAVDPTQCGSPGPRRLSRPPGLRHQDQALLFAFRVDQGQSRSKAAMLGVQPFAQLLGERIEVPASFGKVF